jgi:hypothetical protein
MGWDVALWYSGLPSMLEALGLIPAPKKKRKKRRMMKGMNLTMIYCENFYKCHIVSSVQQ